MKEGEKIDLLLLDSNVFENIELDIPLYHKYRANVFFKDNKVTFIKGGKNLEGTLLFINYNLSKKLELHVEYKKNLYRDVVNGKLKPCSCSNLDHDIFELENENYRVGWKGPMIPWKYINELPNIYLVDINDCEPSNELTVEPSNELTVEPSNELTVEPSNEPTVEPSQDVKQSNDLTVKPSPELIDKTNQLTEDIFMVNMNTPFKIDF